MHQSLTHYDVVAYPAYSHPQTHPDRLAVIGTLHGLKPARVDRCRVLELGCGEGSNLAPMASALPESEFLGLDLAERPIARGQEMIRGAGLTNVRLIQASLSEFEGAGGRFDYIIAHGLYSWVPPDVREHLLALCQAQLAPHGIAFVSYNAFPGSHLRNMVREMMLFHVRGFKSPAERVRQARALIQFLAGAQDVTDEYRLWMKAELETVLGHEGGHFFHDELAEVSEAFTFTQFTGTAAAHGLQYLGEADYFEMFDYGFKDSTRETLKQLGSHRLLREQYLDFLKCRRFRQTLLCHREVPLQTDPLPGAVTRFYISSLARCDGDANQLRPGVRVEYATPKGAKCATDYPLGKAALMSLAANDAMPVRFVELRQQATTMLSGAGIAVEGQGEPPEKLAAFLLELYCAGLVEFRTHLPATARAVSERPAVSPLTRWQAQQGDCVTSQLHVAVKVEDEIGRCLLSSLDGTLDHGALLEKLWQLLKTRGALIMPDGDETAARRKVADDLEKNLNKLARLGLLAA